jgi:hypothetical protein
MSEDVTLAAGTIVEHFNQTTGFWLRVPRVTSTGDTGSLADAKEKTTLEDRIKRYGAGLRDGGDKNFKGQRIPVQVTGAEHAADRVLQDDWITRCKDEEEMQMRITFPDSERALFTFKSLGYMVDDASAEDWKMFSIDGKQNSTVAWGEAPVLTAVAIVGTGALAAAASELVTVTNTPLDAFYEVNQDVFTSDDPSIVAVTKWGFVTGIAAGTADVTVVRKVGDGTTVTNVLSYTVT